MKRCAICELEAWVGFTHCRDCHRTWAGAAECHCVVCHRHFGGEGAFDAHLAEDTCRDPATLKDRDGRHRFHPVQRKDGWVWVKADYRLPRFVGSGEPKIEGVTPEAVTTATEPSPA